MILLGKTIIIEKMSRRMEQQIEFSHYVSTIYFIFYNKTAVKMKFKRNVIKKIGPQQEISKWNKKCAL